MQPQTIMPTARGSVPKPAAALAGDANQSDVEPTSKSADQIGGVVAAERSGGVEAVGSGVPLRDSAPGVSGIVFPETGWSELLGQVRKSFGFCQVAHL